MSAPPEQISTLSVPAFRMRVADLNPRRPHRIEIVPDAGMRAALAEALGLIGLAALRLEGSLQAVGAQDWVLDARMEADVVQPCVVSLGPVSSHLSEDLHRRWTPDLPEPESDDAEMGDDEVDLLGPVIDLGAVLTEALILALPPWPRAQDAELPPDAIDEDDEGGPGMRKPFADLSRLLSRRRPG